MDDGLDFDITQPETILEKPPLAQKHQQDSALHAGFWRRLLAFLLDALIFFLGGLDNMM